MGGDAGALFMAFLVFLGGMFVMSLSLDDHFWNGR